MYWFRVEGASRSERMALFKQIDHVNTQLNRSGGAETPPEHVQAVLAGLGILTTFSQDDRGCYIWKDVSRPMRGATDEVQHIAMVELYYLVQMMKHHLDQNSQERFWHLMRSNCPSLMQAIDTSFRSAYGWGKITFPWCLSSPAFDLDEKEAPSDGQTNDQTVER